MPCPFVSVFHTSCHYRQSLHSATCPRRKSLQGQRRLYLGECPAQLKSSGSRCRPHSRRMTEKAGRMWLISESTTSHCTSNLWGGTHRAADWRNIAVSRHAGRNAEENPQNYQVGEEMDSVSTDFKAIKGGEGVESWARTIENAKNLKVVEHEKRIRSEPQEKRETKVSGDVNQHKRPQKIFAEARNKSWR